MRNSIIIFLTLAFITSFNKAHPQSRSLNKIFPTLADSWYSKKLYDDDSKNFVDDILYGKREATAKAVVKKLKPTEGRTIVFDSELTPEDVFEYINDPDKLFFKNGKAYVNLEDEAHFLTEVDLIGNNNISSKELNANIKCFVAECSLKNIRPDFISVDFTRPDIKYAFVALKLTPNGKIKVYERINSCTTKINLLRSLNIFHIKQLAWLQS